MEARFRHWKNKKIKKVIASYEITIVRYTLTILRKKSGSCEF